MMDDWVTVASFGTVGEAEMARNRLEAEGITARLGNAEAFAMGWVFSGAVQGVQVLVPESSADAAKHILSRIKHTRGPRDDYGLENVTATPEKVRVPVDETAAEGREDDDDEEEVLPPRDVVARRAWRAAVLGLITCPGVAHVYSVFTLMDLSSTEGELTATGKRWVTGAILIDLVVFAIVVLFAVAPFFHK